MNVSVRFSSVSPTSLASSMSLSSVRRVRSSLRASAATSPLAMSARRSRRPASRSSDCRRSTVPRILSISRFFSNGLKSMSRMATEISTRVRATSHFARMYDLFFSQLLIVELHDLFDGPHALAQIIADGDQFLDDNWRARDRLHHHELPALDALGDGDFAFARQQRHRAHLAQVHADRVVGLFQRTGRQVEIALALVRVFLDDHFVVARFGGHFDGARGFGRCLILVNLDAVTFKCREEVVDLFRGVHFRWKRIVYFVVQKVPTLFADGNELAYRIVFFFKTYCRHKFLPKSDCNSKPGRRVTETAVFRRDADTCRRWRSRARRGRDHPGQRRGISP